MAIDANEEETRLLQILNELRAVTRRPQPDVYAYDSIPDYLLNNGRFFKPRELPADVRPQLPKHCYANAADLARRSKGRFRYAEGYALSRIAALHAWCVDAEGCVVDPTWHGDLSAPLVTAYFGVIFDLGLPPKRRPRVPIIDDWRHDYPVLRKRSH